MTKPFFICCDFDGTIADHRYPDIGDEAPGAFRWLRAWRLAGASLILWTMRDNGPKDGPTLFDAVAFCRARGVEFFGVNENPTQRSWTSSPKAYAHVFVDDAAEGCPLRENPRMGGRPYVDWAIVGPSVLAKIETHMKGEK